MTLPCPRPDATLPLHVAAPLVVATCILVAGCGGGSGSGSRPCSIATVDGCVSPEAYGTEVANAADVIRSTPEFDLRPSWDLEAVRVPEAWAHLDVAKGEDKPGSGVTVGVIDTGIDLGHPSFDEAVAAGEITEEFFSGAEHETGEEFSHGTAVSSVIAGRPSPTLGVLYTGIAPYAGLRMFAIPLDSPPPPGAPVEAVTLSRLAEDDESFGPVFREALSRGLDFLNLSIGYDGVIDDYDDVPAIRAAMGATIEALAQADREEKTILVWAAGNSNGDLCRPGTDSCVGDSETDYLGRPTGTVDAGSPGPAAGLMARIEELRGHSIAAVAIGEAKEAGGDGEAVGTGEPGEITSFSNRCGIAANWCIAAPGSGVRAAWFGPYMGKVFRGYASFRGTSLAAPMITGGLALMKQMFRDQLRNEELVARLFHTANKTGIYAGRSVYGQGLMDLDAALSPVGVPGFTAGATVAEGGTPVVQSRLSLGRAFGTGSASGLAGREIAAFDALGAPFWYDLGGLVLLPDPPSAGARLREFISAPSIDRWDAEPDAGAAPAGPRVEFGHIPGDVGAGHALLAPNALSLTWGRPGGVVATADTVPGTRTVVQWGPVGCTSARAGSDGS